MQDKLQAIEQEIRKQFDEDTTGHDWYHIERVRKMALHLQSKEGGDPVIVELAALLHDISDHKMNGGILNAGGKVAEELLKKYDFEQEIIQKVSSIIDKVSFKGLLVPDQMSTLEEKIVQDADRLDAIGAIGIARAFSFGGSKNRPMYQPDISPEEHTSFEQYANAKSHTINHFYEKLLHLKDRLHTDTAKKIGEQRHLVMEDYLKQFYIEWECKM